MVNLEYRSMELLWRISPVSADRLTKVLCSGLYIIADFASIGTEDVDSYLFFAGFLEDTCGCTVEDYLIFKDVEEAIDTYIDAMQWLNVYEVPERLVFGIMLIDFTICYEFGHDISEFEEYDPDYFQERHGLIEFFGSWMLLSREELHEIAVDSFSRMKQELHQFVN